MSAYKLYKFGMSVPEIAEKIWKKKNYISKQACQNSLYYAFRSYKLRMRNSGEAKALSNDRCASCGIHLHKRTPGCKSCSSRHSWRKKRDEKNRMKRINNLRIMKLCTGCEVPIAKHTLGCESCSERHSKRARRAA